MRKFLIVFILLLVICSVSACNFNNPTTDSQTVYDMVVNLNVDDGTLSCHQEVIYTNNTTNNIDELKFNLYPNAYREGAVYEAISNKHKATAYYSGDSFGDIEIIKVKSKTAEIAHSVGGLDKNILTVQLPETLKNNDTVSIMIEYIVTLPKTTSRLGITKNGINGGNFHPILCIYENGDWITEPYYNIGDPFYSETSNYAVQFNINGKGLLATSGCIVESYNKNGINTSIIDATNVRDFAFVYLENGKKISERIDGIDVNYYYTSDENAEFSLECAVNSIKIFNEYFGKYPYRSYNVVDTDFVYGGMEYPNLVFISSKLTDIQREYTIAHETAHQWWYGVIGSNSISNAWLDEGLTEFSSAFYFKKTNRLILFYSFIQASHLNYIAVEKNLRHLKINFDGVMTKSLADFPNESAYIITAYDKGQMLFASMYEIIGERNFLNAIQKYYNSFKYKNATPDDLLSCFRVENRKLINLWLEGKVIIPSVMQ